MTRTRVRTVHRCAECGASSPQWSGRCPGCGEWNSLVEERDPAAAAGAGLAGLADRRARGRAHPALGLVRGGVAGGPLDSAPRPLLEVDAGGYAPRPTGIGELDRVLGGGLVPGGVTLLGGEPGIGKSTLLLQVAAALAVGGGRCLVVTAEESAQQVRLRAERLGALHAGVLVQSETALPTILDGIEQAAPDLVVVDSVQTIFDPDIGSAPGSVAQVRECAHQLVQVAKATGIAIVLVGHVTKEGALAGPRVLEHVVDTVLAFDGDRHHALRLLRAVKHRFGPTGQLGLFEMTDAGLSGVPDASGLFLGDRRPGTAGSCVVPAMEGDRPLLCEIQALAAHTNAPMPRRSAQGLDSSRLSLLLAVLERRVGLSFLGFDVFASVVGGVRVTEPACDLAVGLALTSAATGVAVDARLVACGEVGLGGEIRQVAHTPRRLAEAARLGFTEALVPASSPDGPPGLRVRRVRSLAEAITAAGLSPSEGGGA